MFKFCPNCTKETMPGWKCCPYCGFKFEEVGAGVPSATSAGSALDDALGNLMGFATEKQAEEAIDRDFEIEDGVLIKYKGNGGDVVIPECVTRIEHRAFEGCNSLISITIPNSVTAIGGWAFLNCNNLIKIEIPDSITSIEDCAFMRCNSLTSVLIGRNVARISGTVFSGCVNLNSLVVKSGNIKFHSIDNCVIETVEKALVAGCKNSRLPTDGSVTRIKHHAFTNCRGLMSIMIPNGITSIDDYAFCECTNLMNIMIPNSVVSIGEGAFYDCDNLISVTISSDCQIVSGPYEAYNSFPNSCTVIRR